MQALQRKLRQAKNENPLEMEELEELEELAELEEEMEEQPEKNVLELTPPATPPTPAPPTSPTSSIASSLDFQSVSKQDHCLQGVGVLMFLLLPENTS